jgi:hypothetical protein
MLWQLASLMLALPMGLDKALSALHDKLSPSIHAKAALDAKVAMLAEMNAPNRRSKAMEKTLGLQSIHDTAKNNASSSLSTSYDAYDLLKEKCIGCKLAEDSLVSQLEVVISLHTTADEKLTEYNSAKAEAADATDMAATLETTRDIACSSDPLGVVVDLLFTLMDVSTVDGEITKEEFMGTFGTDCNKTALEESWDGIAVADALAGNENGKIDKEELKALFEMMMKTEDRSPAPGMAAKLGAVIQGAIAGDEGAQAQFCVFVTDGPPPGQDPNSLG